MTRYQRIWRLFAGAVAVFGVVLDVLTHPLSSIVALGAVALGVSLCVGLGMRVGEPGTLPPLRVTGRKIVNGAVLGTVWLVALAGLASASALTMLFVGVVVVVTSPPVVRRALGAEVDAADPADAGRPSPGRPTPTRPVEVERSTVSVDVAELASADVTAMDTRELVRDWRRSFVALERAGDPASKAAVVQARQAFLDELERRDPAGLHEWLESGARAAGDPTKFMSGGEHGHGGPQAA
jgi:hypothetical protein